MLQAAHDKFSQQPGVQGEEIVTLAEITMCNLRANGEVDLRDFIARADTLAACGLTVLISDYFEYYRLAAYLAKYSRKKIGITMGAGSLGQLFDEKYYAGLEGGILESFGRLFKNDLKLFIYPLLNQADGSLTTIDNLQVASDLRHLYQHLVTRGCILQLDAFNPKHLNTFSRETLAKIQRGDSRWMDDVPPAVAQLIQQRSLFGYTQPKAVASPAPIVAAGGWPTSVNQPTR
jgi:hypothetical protein